LRYFITFACYGAHLHGDEPGSVDRHHNVPGTRLAEANPKRVAMKRQQMDQAPYLLDRHRRATVLESLREVCLQRGWSLFAAHVRTNHVHAVVEADVRPEKIMHAFKSYASRNLNRLMVDEPDRKRWARHGSTRWLWKDEDVQKAICYVVSGQGEAMEVHRIELL
jgi:REP element-mobilizing transposase RayT